MSLILWPYVSTFMNPSEDKMFPTTIMQDGHAANLHTNANWHHRALFGSCQVMETGWKQAYSHRRTQGPRCCWTNMVLGLVCMREATQFDILYTVIRIYGESTNCISGLTTLLTLYPHSLDREERLPDASHLILTDSALPLNLSLTRFSSVLLPPTMPSPLHLPV